MKRYEGLENDISYLAYLDKIEYVKGLINNELDNHEAAIDIEWIVVMLEGLEQDKKDLDELKKWKEIKSCK